MNKAIKNIKFSQAFLACWALLLLANFLPAIPQPSTIIGYLWKIEFALAAFLLIAVVLLYKFSDKFTVQISQTEFVWILLPLVLFTAWSGFSVLWAESARSAIHHTLLWACYIVFYLLIRQIAAKPQFLNVSIAVSGLVIVILGAVCLSEYLTTSAEMSVNVSLRYSKYAEAIATLLVLFVALAIQKRNRNSLLCGAVALIGWLAIVFSLGRTQFIAGLFGICVFATFSLIKSRRKIAPKKALIFASLFILATVFSQLSFTSNPNQTTLKRLSGDEHSQTSFQVRILVWQIAFENFKQNSLYGAGAENFGNNYHTARKAYAEANPTDKNLAHYEEILPERAHNEFLQILAELGLVGIAIFGWLLFGILKIAFSIKKTSLLSIAAFAGISVFLLSSLASSYSFRVPANGLCFFFLLAFFASRESRVESRESVNRHSPLLTVGFIICVAMLTFSAVRGVSLMYLEMALKSSEAAETEVYFQKAIAFDEQNELFRYYYGVHLFNEKHTAESIPQMRFAIDKGIATSISYFNLSSAQIVAKQQDEAERTLAEGLQVYPRSVFLRTAYGYVLQENGKTAEAANQYEKAANINPEQARSWRIAFTEGMLNLSQTEARDKQFVKTMDLRPTDGIYALLDFQRQFRPNLVRR